MLPINKLFARPGAKIASTETIVDPQQKRFDEAYSKAVKYFEALQGSFQENWNYAPRFSAIGDIYCKEEVAGATDNDNYFKNFMIYSKEKDIARINIYIEEQRDILGVLQIRAWQSLNSEKCRDLCTIFAQMMGDKAFRDIELCNQRLSSSMVDTLWNIQVGLKGEFWPQTWYSTNCELLTPYEKKPWYDGLEKY